MPPAEGPAAVHDALLGVATALVSAALVLVPIVLAWLAEPTSSVTFGRAAGFAAAAWFLLQGAHLVGQAGELSLTPLLLTLIPLLVAGYGARSVLAGRLASEPETSHRVLPRAAWAGLAAWGGGYAVVLAVMGWLASNSALAPALWSTSGSVAVPALAALLALWRAGRRHPWLWGSAVTDRALPQVVRKGVRPGLVGAGWLLAIGALVVMVVVGFRLSRVTHVHAALDAGLLGGGLLWGAQLAAWPNLALWAVSFLTGPGFQVVDGGAVTWSGAGSALLPPVPVFAALPEPGSFPGLTPLVVLLPLAVGVSVGRGVLAGLAKLARPRTKLGTTAVACVTAALALGALDLLGGGALGGGRLGQVGAPAGWLVVSVLAVLAVGAFPTVLWDVWRRRR